jgi:hypothetical protein
VLGRNIAPAARPGRGRRDQAGRDGERERHVQARAEAYASGRDITRIDFRN